MNVPERPKIYHIVHEDRFQSIVSEERLWYDAEIVRRLPCGTSIGMNDIKRRRLHELTLASHPGLHVGDCVPFYFCPRSVMLYILRCGNHPDLEYHGGQEPVIHLEADLYETVRWAGEQHLRWAFTTSNAGSRYFEDYSELSKLDKINWDAVGMKQWSHVKEGKQAEFLVENHFPWSGIERIGVHSEKVRRRVEQALSAQKHRPILEVMGDWYY
jgi:hypothetical protein